MERNIVVYNNHTGIVGRLIPLLAGEGIRLHAASDWDQLVELLQSGKMQLMLMDAELSEENLDRGVALIGRIRQLAKIPIIILSSQKAEIAKILTLNAGADDYVTDDCNPLVLMARVKSQLRRYNQLVNMQDNIERIYRVDGLEINDLERRVTVDGRAVKLTPIEYQILRLLVQKRGRVLSIAQIYEAIWHMQAIGADNTIAVHIRHIREKIESNPRQPRYLKVVWGTGYKVG